MFRKPGFGALAIAVLTCLLSIISPSRAQAQMGSQVAPIITQGIDESKLVTLKGNTRPEANPGNDRGPVLNNLPIEHMLLQLRRSPQQEQSLKQFIDELHNPDSPDFHKWLTAQQFGERFGLAQQDLDTISRWLESHGFKVSVVYPSGILIDFSGTAGQVHSAFHTEIHQLEVNGVKHIANMRDPQIPAALAPAVAGIVSLHDFRPHPMLQMHKARPLFTDSNGNFTVVPGDLATIYNLNPVFSSGISGQGQTIVVIEDGDLYSMSDWTTFRSTFGLSSYTLGSLTQIHPAPPTGSNNCSDPGVIGTAMNPVDAEAILDAEYASAAAPSAAIQVASCADLTPPKYTFTFGGLIALQNLINAANPPAIVSISYGECEAVNGATANSMYNMTYQQAVAEGVSAYVAAGDSGAAGCDQGLSAAVSGIAVSGFASTPYNVAVGGTDFGDTYAGTNATYWNSSDSSNYASALSYIPEIPWNDSCTGALLDAYVGYPAYGSDSLCNAYGGLLASLLGVLATSGGSGGPSGCATGSPSINGVVSGSCAGYPKPSWQTVYGNPCGSNCGSSTNDGVRDIPDVSLFAAAGLWSHYYVFCFSNPADGGAPCTGDPSGWAGAGGTSFASPIMAGVQALINQKTGSRQGNPNPIFYSLANAEYGSGGNSSCNSNAAASTCIFHDVTLGDMAVDCAYFDSTHLYNCYDPGGTSANGFIGVLSTSNSAYQSAYGTAIGWDFATGIGTVNIANLVNNWPNLNPAVLSITKTHTGNFTQGQQNATYTVTVSNGASAGSTNGTVTVTETVPSGLALMSIAGTGWACAVSSCTRSDALSGGFSYAPITVSVDVAGNASSPQVNEVMVSGGGSATAGASDPTTITGGSNGDGGPPMLFVPVAPCRVADTRNANGPFGGPSLSAGSSRSFTIPNSACGIPSTAAAYSLNVTVVPHQPLGYLTMWPTGQSQPLVSTLNSTDGRIKANAAIVPAGSGRAISVFATDPTDVVLDINGYFVPTTVSGALAFYPVTPCRLVDTRLAPGPLAGPSMIAGQSRSFPLLSSSCNIPSTAQAYSLNFTAVPDGPLNYLTVWPSGLMQPLVSTLNAPTGTITANAAIVPAGSSGAISLYVTNNGDMVIDINGYFAPPATGGLSFLAVVPCRVLDTRAGNGQPFSGTINVDVTASNCGAPAQAQTYVFNATVVPSGGLSYLTLWPQSEAQPLVSTLNATDGTITSNMAIVPTINGSISAYATSPTQLILDISGYFAP